MLFLILECNIWLQSDCDVLGINLCMNGRQSELPFCEILCHRRALTNGSVPNVVHVNMFPWQCSFQSRAPTACNVPRNSLFFWKWCRERMIANFYLEKKCLVTDPRPLDWESVTLWYLSLLDFGTNPTHTPAPLCHHLCGNLRRKNVQIQLVKKTK